ncbi:P-loop containing nucleoside triphosphate hydrolase protein, partial [Podospora didyma]
LSDTIEELLDTARLRRILEMEPSTPDGDQNLELKTGKIEFRGVSFSFPGSDRLIINDLSFVLELSSTVAFVGRSGAGKSTIYNPLMRNLVPPRIQFSSMTRISRQSRKTRGLYEHIVMMPQITYMFDRMAAHNVKYGNLDATEQEMHEACRKAGIYETIEAREDGYETLLGDNGLPTFLLYCGSTGLNTTA